MRRDVALDYLRAIAMFCMVGAHFTSTLPQLHPTSPYLSNLSQSAATWFLFSFGMTTVFMLQKSPAVQQRRLLFFLVVALLNNLFRAQHLFGTEVLFSLWAMQAILVVTESYVPAPNRAYMGVSALILLALMVVPSPAHRLAFETAFQLTLVGPFPVLPWGLYVLAGLLFSRQREWFLRHRRGALLAALAPVVLCAPALLPEHVPLWFQHHPQFVVHNHPLSPTYILVYVGLAIAVALIIDRYPAHFSRLPVIGPLVRFTSANLLVCYVLHTVATRPLRQIATRLLTTATPPYVELAVRIGGWLLCAVLTAALTAVVLEVWRRVAGSKTLVLMRTALPATMASLIIATSALNAATATSTAMAQGAVRWVTWAALVYAVLEMTNWRATPLSVTPHSDNDGLSST